MAVHTAPAPFLTTQPAPLVLTHSASDVVATTVLFSVGTTSGAELGVLSYVILTGLVPTCLTEGLGVNGETWPSWFSRGHSTGRTVTTLARVEVVSTVLAEYTSTTTLHTSLIGENPLVAAWAKHPSIMQ